MAGNTVNIKRSKNRFYRSLKLKKETKKLVSFFCQIKEKMLKGTK